MSTPSSPRVTLRFSEEPGPPSRAELTSLTQRYAPPTHPAPRAPTAADVIAGHYRVLAGPLGDFSGEADVFHCQDEATHREVAVKLYRYHASPNPTVIAQLQGLAHPNIVRLFTYGRWQDRYYEVMEYCAGGVFAEQMPMPMDRLLRYLPGLLAGLAFCHRQGIVHRDIKPNNLFFRDTDCTEALIGDFGISSYLDTEQLAKITRSAANLTLDYAAPEFLDRHEIGSKTDFYALGITIAHLLTGRSPFHGWLPHDVLVAHLRQRIPLPAVDLRTEQMLRGLLQFDPAQRWGYVELQGWLNGESIPSLPVVAPFADPGHRVPFPAWPAATDPIQLAAALDRFDAPTALVNGQIRKWVTRHFQPDLDRPLRHLETAYSEQPRQAIVRLRYLLDPSTPLLVDDLPVPSLPALAALLARDHDESLQQALHEALWLEAIEAWIIASEQAGERRHELAERIAGIRDRVRYSRRLRVGLFALRYLLQPQQPLWITETLSVTNPRELALAFRDDPDRYQPRLGELLDTMQLEEWIRACEFPDWEALVTLLREVRIRYLEQPDIRAHCFAWRFLPELPLVVGTKGITEPAQLATLIDADDAGIELGLRLLQEGWISAWLLGTQRIASLADIDAILTAAGAHPRAHLEAILGLLDPQRPPPRISVTPTELRPGIIIHGRRIVLELDIHNAGRGWLSGFVEVDRLPILIEPLEFAGNHCRLRVTFDPHASTPGLHRGEIVLRSNGGEIHVPVQFVVAHPVEPRKPWWQTWLDRFIDPDG